MKEMSIKIDRKFEFYEGKVKKSSEEKEENFRRKRRRLFKKW